MNTFCENLIRGAASVTLIPNTDYRSSIDQYTSMAKRMGVPLSIAVIKKIAFERFLGQVIFSITVMSFMIVTVILSDYNQLLAICSAILAFVSWLIVHQLHETLD